jgi:hypothetical protein
MKSKLWVQSLHEVRSNPYDYESQKLFLNEASSILDEIFKKYDKYQVHFNLDERTLKKALWMLHLDALDTLRDCIYLLKKRKHRIVGKLFRDITETLDLATLFFGEEKDGKFVNLMNWYDNKVVPHRKFRKHLEKTKGQFISDYSKGMYEELSEFSHHCYNKLKNSYSLGGKNGNMLVYDSHSEILILPQTIAEYTWEVKQLMFYFLDNIKRVGLVDWNEIKIFCTKTITEIRFV